MSGIPSQGGFRLRYYPKLQRWAYPPNVPDDLDPDPARNQDVVDDARRRGDA